MPALARAHHCGELGLAEHGSLRRGLHLHQSARAGDDEVGVGLRLRILGVVEVEHRRALVDAAGDRGDVVAQRIVLDDRAAAHPLEAVVECDPGAGDRGRPCAAVGLQDVAIESDLALAHALQVCDRAQAAADEPLDLLGSAGRLAGGRFAARTRVRGARQHRIFGGDPAAPLAAQPRRRLVLERGGAQHVRAAELDEGTSPPHSARPSAPSRSGAARSARVWKVAFRLLGTKSGDVVGAGTSRRNVIGRLASRSRGIATI